MKRALPSFLLVCFFSVFISNAQAAPKVAYFTVNVPPKQFKALKIKRLPQNAYIGVEVESSQPLSIAFVDTADYINLPNPKRPLMVSKVDKRLTFSVTIPTSGDYFVVLVNLSEASAADARIKVQAQRSPPGQREGADQILLKFEQQMHKLFVFDTFNTGVKRCGQNLAFYGTDGFYLCTEYVKLIYAEVPDRKMAINVLGFSIFHELGLQLLQQWGLGGRSLRKTADEFALVLMVMLQQEANLRQLGTYFVQNPSVAAAFENQVIDRWHPLSVERAKTILRRLNDPNLVRSWQKRLVPHMQTDLLLRLQQKPTEWTNLALVHDELASRRQQSLPSTEHRKEKKGKEF